MMINQDLEDLLIIQGDGKWKKAISLEQFAVNFRVQSKLYPIERTARVFETLQNGQIVF